VVDAQPSAKVARGRDLDGARRRRQHRRAGPAAARVRRAPRLQACQRLWNELHGTQVGEIALSRAADDAAAGGVAGYEPLAVCPRAALRSERPRIRASQRATGIPRDAVTCMMGAAMAAMIGAVVARSRRRTTAPAKASHSSVVVDAAAASAAALCTVRSCSKRTYSSEAYSSERWCWRACTLVASSSQARTAWRFRPAASTHASESDESPGCCANRHTREPWIAPGPTSATLCAYMSMAARRGGRVAGIVGGASSMAAGWSDGRVWYAMVCDAMVGYGMRWYAMVGYGMRWYAMVCEGGRSCCS